MLPGVQHAGVSDSGTSLCTVACSLGVAAVVMYCFGTSMPSLEMV
jgi:hypothetical protein